MRIFGKLYYPDAIDDGHGRIFFYDNLRFVLITLVVMRHFLFRVHESFPVIEGLYMLFLSFLMPLFIFVTGFYAKSVFSKEGSFRIGRILMFIILYFLLDFALYITAYAVRGGGGSPWNPLIMVNAAWYLWACAAWFALIPLLRRTPPVPTVLVSVVISLAIGYWSSVYYWFSLSKIFTFLPFFAAGYYLTKDKLGGLLALGARWRVVAWAIIAVIAVFVIIYHTEVNFWIKRVLEGKDPYAVAWANRGLWELGALWRLCWYAGSAFMCACAMLIMPRCRTFFTAFGSRTLQIYIWHSIIVRAIAPTGLYLWLDSLGAGLGQITMTALAIVLTFLLSWKPLGAPFNALEKVTRGLTIGSKRASHK